MRNFHMLHRIFVALAIALLALPSTHRPADAQGYYEVTGARIDEIRIMGVERIEPSTVMTYMDISVGDKMTQETLDTALKSLFATGLFADVTLKQRGSILEVNVVENPIISQIAFEGNDQLDDDELKAEISLRPRQVFTRTKVQSDVNRLYQIYQRNGRFSANIEPKVIKLDQNRVNLVFEIQEGAVTKVKSIRFVGNKNFDDDKLRSEITTREDRWYSFISTADRYDPDRVAFDQEMLRRFYLSQGYADFNLISAIAELSANREHFFLTFTISEGERYKVRNVHINSSIRNFDASALSQHVTFEPGDWYDADEVQYSIDHLTDALGDMQYAFVNVQPDIVRNRDENMLDVIFNINETPRVFVERIDIRGNVRTLDKVIRREMLLVEGDPFNRSKLARSEQQVRDLAFFEQVTVTPTQGSAPDKTVIDVEVSEQSTGELSLGAGFSTSDGPLADVRITERNLLGKGQELFLAAVVAGERTEFDLGFTEPYFLDRDFSAGFDLFHMTRDLQDESSYDIRRTGGSVRFGYPLSEKWRQTLRYSLSRNEITDVESNASLFVQAQEGDRVTSQISQRLTYDDRDSAISPTDGLYAWFDTAYAGIGGDVNHVSAKVGASYYYSVAPNWILNFLGETGGIEGTGGEDVRINERFFLGGSSLRGFESAGIGPRDTVTDDALGGNYFYRGSAELTFPVGLPEELGIKAHTFTDFGSLWELDGVYPASVESNGSIRATAGVGVSWRSPLGPIRVDLATPYASEGYDKEEVFRFNFGTRF